jgi:NAD(P)H-hydrate epimerase
MTLPLSEERDGTLAASALDVVLAHSKDVIAAGPGIGTGPSQRAFVEGLLARSRVPLVLDADALTVLAPAARGDHGERGEHGGAPAANGERGSLAAGGADEAPRIAGLEGRDDRPVIVTPHPGELSRLTGIATSDIQRNRIDVARSFARRHGVFVVLKGHRTVIATPGGRVSVNPTGNPGMATGGSGDVLTGMVAAWLAQLKDPEAACRLAVYLHGVAGDLGAGSIGGGALTANDIVGHLGGAMLELAARDADRPRA